MGCCDAEVSESESRFSIDFQSGLERIQGTSRFDFLFEFKEVTMIQELQLRILPEEAVSEHLGIKDGETTEDGLFTLNNVACLGCCSLAPVMMIKTTDGEETYGNLTKSSVVKILDDIKAQNA